MTEGSSFKKILIIYPHWHPTNLAGVHRPRLIGNFLKELGWRPYVLTVREEYFEETPDPDFIHTFSKDFNITRVKALKAVRPRIVGDIGLRAFNSLYTKGKEIIKEEKIDFIWLPIPSFYNSLLGRLLYEKTKIPYGIDYIDPWVRDLTNQSGLRAELSQTFARFLEPIAIKKAALISGVSAPYYEPALKRNFPGFYDADKKLLPETINPNTGKKIAHIAMPYGFDPRDHNMILENVNFPWNEEPEGQKNWIYAGAFLPNSHVLLSAFFEAVQNLRKRGLWDESIRLWFIGTGEYPAKKITEYATEFGLKEIVKEKRERYPFLQVLNFLSAADTVMIIGSTEKHYTASKTFQALLSKKPVISVFHKESSAVEIMQECSADQYTVRYDPDEKSNKLVARFEKKLLKRLSSRSWNPNLSALDKFSAKESARRLVNAIERATVS
ncbi:MAG: hypothetical protein O2U61_00290 [Candidatus Bathyarchaeota archaeon]|nr:hypothetical protein [Candidatus Bathyarchaeota archaeon]